MITDYEFSEFVKLYNSLFSVNFDRDKIKSWHEILKGLKIKGLIASIQSLATKEDFPPSIKKIVVEYEALKQRQEREIREKQIAEQQKYLLTQSEGQYICPICGNKGGYFYLKNGYEYYCRCICAHGRDLNKWSKYQITKDMPWNNPKTNKDENLYILALDDIFSQEDIEIIKLKKTEIDKEIDFPQMYQTQLVSITQNFSIAN